MNMEFINKRKDAICMLAIVIAAVFLMMAILKIADYTISVVKVNSLSDKALARHESGRKDTDKYFAASKKLASELKQKNLFLPPKSNGSPINVISGILGNEVLIGDKWYKQGDKIADVQIIEISACMVTVKWKDKELKLSPMMSSSSANGQNNNKPQGDRRKGRRGKNLETAAISASQ